MSSPEPPILLLDNGGADIKAGLAGGNASSVVSVPNLVATRAGRPSLAGAAVTGHMHELSAYSVRRPVERGCVTSWDVQRDIWDAVLRGLRVHASETQLVVTEPPGTPMLARSAMDALVFEEMGFLAYWAALPQVLVTEHTHRSSLSALVVDCGFSATFAVPVVGGAPVTCASRRLNIGGKLLTNLLKETISYRSWNMMDETFLVNHVKETCCFVSKDYMAQLDSNKAERDPALRCDYLLPDRTKPDPDNPFGCLREKSNCAAPPPTPEQQILKLTTERIAVPEVLFSPQDIGLKQCGVAELIVEAVEATPVHLWEGLYSNVVLTGGSSQFDGFARRLERELRPLVADHYQVNVSRAADPVRGAVLGANSLVHKGTAQANMVTKEEYEEHGHSQVLRRFLESWLVPEVGVE